MSLRTIYKQIRSSEPFSLLPPSDLELWVNSSEIAEYSPGERLVRPDEFNSKIFLVLSGQVRLLSNSFTREGQVTLDLRGPGQLIGWASYMLAEPTEFVQASTQCRVLALPANDFVSALLKFPSFLEYFSTLGNLNETFSLVASVVDNSAYKDNVTFDSLLSAAKDSTVFSLNSPVDLLCLPKPRDSHSWF